MEQIEIKLFSLSLSQLNQEKETEPYSINDHKPVLYNNKKAVSFLDDTENFMDRNMQDFSRDRDTTPTSIENRQIEELQKFEFDTPLSTLTISDEHENHPKYHKENLQENQHPLSTSILKKNVDDRDEEKLFLNGIEVTAKTEVESPTGGKHSTSFRDFCVIFTSAGSLCFSYITYNCVNFHRKTTT